VLLLLDLMVGRLELVLKNIVILKHLLAVLNNKLAMFLDGPATDCPSIDPVSYSLLLHVL